MSAHALICLRYALRGHGSRDLVSLKNEQTLYVVMWSQNFYTVVIAVLLLNLIWKWILKNEHFKSCQFKHFLCYFKSLFQNSSHWVKNVMFNLLAINMFCQRSFQVWPSMKRNYCKWFVNTIIKNITSHMRNGQ